MFGERLQIKHIAPEGTNVATPYTYFWASPMMIIYGIRGICTGGDSEIEKTHEVSTIVVDHISPVTQC